MPSAMGGRGADLAGMQTPGMAGVGLSTPMLSALWNNADAPCSALMAALLQVRNDAVCTAEIQTHACCNDIRSWRSPMSHTSWNRAVSMFLCFQCLQAPASSPQQTPQQAADVAMEQ